MVKKYEDWCIILFSKKNYNEKYEKNPLCVNKKILEDTVVVLTFRGTTKQITNLIVSSKLSEETKFPQERSILMIIDKEGIVR